MRLGQEGGRTNILEVRPIATSAILVEHLTKRYGALKAVRGFDFTVERGVCFTFLGPNGAGESSTIRIISCPSPLTSGRLEVLGMAAGIKDRLVEEHKRKHEEFVRTLKEHDRNMLTVKWADTTLAEAVGLEPTDEGPS